MPTNDKKTRDPGAAREAVRGAADELNAKRTAVADALLDYRSAQVAGSAVNVDLRPVWEHLARPFPQEDVERLPRNLRKGDQDKGRCEAGSRYCGDDHPCGGWHARSIHLDYIGHAGITMRLNEVVGPENWTLEPYTHDQTGLPLMARGEFWARLTVLGVTKLDVATNYDSTQEALGDVLRRTASRFGVGTYLWSKSERSLALKRATDDVEPEAQRPGDRDAGDRPAPDPVPEHVANLTTLLRSLDQANADAIRAWWPKDFPPLGSLSETQARAVRQEAERLLDPWANQQPTNDPWATPPEGAQDPQDARQ